MEKYINNIKRVRRLKGLTQKQLAEALHVEHTTVSNYENGKRKVDIEMYAKIAHVLGVKVKDLIDIEIEVEEIGVPSNDIRKNFDIKTYNKEINPKNMIVQIYFILIAFVVFAFSIMKSETTFIIFFFSFLVFILDDLYRLFFPKKSIDSFSVSVDKKVSFQNITKRSTKSFSLWLGVIIFNYFAIIFISALVYIGVNLIGSESYLNTLYSFFLILVVILMCINIVIEFKKFRLQVNFPFDMFSYKLDLFVYKFTIILVKLMYLYAYTSIYYFRDTLNKQFYWIYLIFTPFIIFSVYEMFSQKLKHLSGYMLNITD